MSRVIAVTSGKGGVGKSNISLNLAIHLSETGHRTCLFDADLGLANINILLGLQPEYDLKDLLFRGRPLREILIRGPGGIDILPGSSGMEEVANLPPDRMESLLRSFSEMKGYDFLLFDTSAGISKNVVSFCLASPEVILVITPEPTSLTDAFALLKVLLSNGFQGRVKVVVNLCRNAEAAKEVYKKFKDASRKYLDRDVPALGVVYQDGHVTEAVKRQKALLTLYPDSPASRCIRKLAERLADGGEGENLHLTDEEGFWRRCLTFFRSPLDLPRKKEDLPEKTPATLSSGEQREEKEHSNSPAGEIREEPQKIEEPSPPETSDSGETPLKTSLEPSFLPLIEKLTEGILSVSHELKLVREAIARNGNGKTLSHGQETDVSVKRPTLHLDLDAFLRERGE
jgi:flagellar biosynthesis protein FlhG